MERLGRTAETSLAVMCGAVGLCLVPAAVVVGGCEGTQRRDDERWSSRDSAGIHIVESTAPIWSEGARWSINGDATVTVGIQEGNPAYEFSKVWAASRSRDGRIAVSDGGAGEIRIFGANGKYLLTVGREGLGPGEFQEGPFVSWQGPNVLLAWDPGARRLTWFDGGGGIVREQSLLQLFLRHPVEVPRGSPGAWELLRDGTLLAVGFRIDPRVDPHAVDERWRYTYPLYIVPPDGDTVVSLGECGFEESISTSQGIGVKNPFVRWVRPAAGSREVFVVGSQQWEITGIGRDGSVQRIVRARVPRAPISEEMVQRQRDEWRAMAERNGVRPSMFLDALEQFAVPNRVPAIRSIYTDLEGNLWVSRNVEIGQEEDLAFDIIDSEGRWLGTMDAPAGLRRVLEIGADYMIGLWHGELDVQIVRLYEIHK